MFTMITIYKDRHIEKFKRVMGQIKLKSKIKRLFWMHLKSGICSACTPWPPCTVPYVQEHIHWEVHECHEAYQSDQHDQKLVVLDALISAQSCSWFIYEVDVQNLPPSAEHNCACCVLLLATTTCCCRTSLSVFCWLLPHLLTFSSPIKSSSKPTRLFDTSLE
jgi:hypothetical protein